jgi:hypothetical protein
MLRQHTMGIEAGGGGTGANPENQKPPQQNQSEGTPNNIDLRSLRPLPNEREAGSGGKKPGNLSPQAGEKPVFEKPLITEAERAANERWGAITKRMERYTQEQEDKIDNEWFDRVTA